jgi:predicted nucleic acid-binding protein
MFLLDTNVISEIRRPSRHGSVLHWFADQHPNTIFVPSIVFLELQRGVELTRLQNPAKATEIEIWIDDLVLSSNVVDFDVEAAREYSRLKRRRLNFVSEDAMIAAVARVHGYTVATRNTRNFQPFGVAVVDPFKYKL